MAQKETLSRNNLYFLIISVASFTNKISEKIKGSSRNIILNLLISEIEKQRIPVSKKLTPI